MKRCILLFLLIILLAGCSTRKPEDKTTDSAPNRTLDPNSIQDAVPRAEPRSRYGNPESYVVFGKRYRVMRSGENHVERGIASWYGTKFHGRRTSSGEPYDMYAMTAAHKTLPLPAYVMVTNLRNGRSAVVKVNDRGPFHENRIIDLSYAAATKLGIIGKGTGLVEIQTIDPGRPYETPVAIQTVAGAAPELFIQVGAFSSRMNADRLRRRLQSSLEYNVRVLPGLRANSEVYRVQVGPVRNTEQADALSQQLAQQGMNDQHIVIE